MLSRHRICDYNREEALKIQYKIIIFLVAFILMLSGCSSGPNGGSPVLEFFGFSTPSGNQAPADQPQKAQNVPQAESDPFGVNNSSETKTGGGLSDLDWDDDIDPALIDLGESESETKSGGSAADDWRNDPNAWSFSGSSFEEVPQTNQEKQAPVPQAPNQPRIDLGQGQGQRYPDNPSITLYPIRNNPVFRPMREFPRTGFPTGITVDIKESFSYTATNMSLTIPNLNITEDIVVVPLVDETYPVEALGEKIGLLEGSGPGPEDLFVLVGHNHLNTQESGPFLELSALKESDLIFVRGAKDASRTFVVYANEKFESEDIEGLVSYVKPGCMILITCEDESIDGGYINRRVVFAEAKEN